jgi:iron complex outermembrane recepter protein
VFFPPPSPGVIDVLTGAGFVLLRSLFGERIGLRVNGWGIQIVRNFAKLILLSTSTLAPLCGAQAQSAPEEAADKDGKEIIVTGSRVEGYKVDTAQSATKTDVALIDTPMSVQVISHDVIRDMGATDLYDVVRNISGVTRRASYWGQNTSTFNIRGFDLDNENGYLKDGFRYFAEGKVVLGNVDRVEILKGPASVLYGRAQPGGIANLVSKRPSAKLSGGAELAYGRWNSLGITADINGALTKDESLMGRIDAEYSSADSFRDTVFSKTLMISPQLLWKPGADTTIRLKGEYVHDHSKPDYGVPAFDGRPANVPISTYYGEPFDNQESEQINVTLSAEHNLSNDWLIRGSLSYYRLGYSDDTKDTYNSWIDGSTLNRYYENFPKWDAYKTAQFETVGKFATFGLGHTLLLGAEYDIHDSDSGDGYVLGALESPIDIFNPVPVGNEQVLLDAVLAVGYKGVSKTKSWSLYAQDQIDLSDKLKLLIGGRYDNVEQNGTYKGTFISDGSLLWEGSYGFKADAFSPRAGLLYKINDGLSVYASWSKSFNPNYADCDQLTGICRQFPSEIGVQYEGGVKFEAANGRFGATASLFKIEKSNVLQTDPADPNLQVVDGKHRSQGLELDLSGEPINGLSIIASYAYIDAIVAESTDYLVGGQLPNAAKHTASLWVTYDWEIGNGGTLSFGGGGNYQSRRFTHSAVTESDIIVLPGYVVADVMAAYEQGDWRLALNITNLANKRYYESSTGYGGAVIYPGTPRGWRLSLSKRF